MSFWSLVAALPVGVAWWLLAPLTLVQKRADGLYRVGGEGDESAIGADGWFAGIGLVAGILVALVVYVRTRPGRVGPLIALVAGGVLGSFAAWQLGHLLGPGPLLSQAAEVPVGARFRGPLDISAYGVLLAWPMAAVITYFAVAAGADPAELDSSGGSVRDEPALDGPRPVEPALDEPAPQDPVPAGDGEAVSPAAPEQSGPR